MTPRTDPADRRTEILDAALRCFLRTGYHRTSMDDVVRETGLSKGTLYWHFENKQDLFLSLFDRVLGEMLALVPQPDPTLPAAEQLAALFDGLASLTGTDSPLMALSLNFLVELWQEEAFSARYRAAIAPFQAQVRDLLETGIAAGDFRPVDADALSWALMAQIDGLLLYLFIGLSTDPARQLRALSDVLLAGLYSA
jgi:TetR/AcrR family transcriptional repressor of uid operon